MIRARCSSELRCWCLQVVLRRARVVAIPAPSAAPDSSDSTDGDTGIATEIPATFPSSVPLIDGEVAAGIDVGTGWSVVIKTDDLGARIRGRIHQAQGRGIHRRHRDRQRRCRRVRAVPERRVHRAGHGGRQHGLRAQRHLPRRDQVGAAMRRLLTALMLTGRWRSPVARCCRSGTTIRPAAVPTAAARPARTAATRAATRTTTPCVSGSGQLPASWPDRRLRARGRRGGELGRVARLLVRPGARRRRRCRVRRGLDSAQGRGIHGDQRAGRGRRLDRGLHIGSYQLQLFANTDDGTPSLYYTISEKG